MPKTKYLYLTEVVTSPNEAGEAKIKRIENGIKPTDVNGHTIDLYIENDLRPPKELLEESEEEGISDDGMIELVEDEFDYQYNNCLINLDDFMMASDDGEMGATIWLKNKLTIRVDETVELINAQIWFLNRSLWDKLKEKIQLLKEKIKSKHTKTIN
jgi:hypothetical protein